MRTRLGSSVGLTLLAAPSLLLASSAPPPVIDPLRQRIAAALDEAKAAEDRTVALEKAAARAGDEAHRLQGQQVAAAEAIAATEARISAADARAQLAAQMMADREARLATAQAPAGSLLAGLALMASRPPLLALLDEGSTDEFVRVRLLLDSTLPEIRRRTASLRAEIDRGRQLDRLAAAALRDASKERSKLAERQRRYAQLEQKALETAELRTGEALASSDVAIARTEDAQQLSERVGGAVSARRIATQLASLPPPPTGPRGPADAGRPDAPAYILPASAKVVEGLGTVAANGVRSRGITLDTARGSTVVAPADGVVRFSGPFRNYDGVVIIDHGGGWTSLLVNVSARIDKGSRVRIGQPLGRALGPIEVELSKDGRRMSPALSAGSSEGLSNGWKPE